MIELIAFALMPVPGAADQHQAFLDGARFCVERSTVDQGEPKGFAPLAPSTEGVSRWRWSIGDGAPVIHVLRSHSTCTVMKQPGRSEEATSAWIAEQPGFGPPQDRSDGPYRFRIYERVQGQGLQRVSLMETGPSEFNILPNMALLMVIDMIEPWRGALLAPDANTRDIQSRQMGCSAQTASQSDTIRVARERLSVLMPTSKFKGITNLCASRLPA